MDIVFGIIFTFLLVGYIAAGLGFSVHVGTYVVDYEFLSWVQSLSTFGVILNVIGIILFLPFILISICVAWYIRCDGFSRFRNYFTKKMYK